MSYAYQVCQKCYGMIRADTKSQGEEMAKEVEISNNMRQKIKDKVAQTTSPNKTFGYGTTYSSKRNEAIKYFNELKNHRKAGKLDPPNMTDDQLWGYAIKVKGLID